MSRRLELEILAQPDGSTCGPTCLHAVYRYFGADVTLDEVVRSVRTFDAGGTLASLLGCDALRRGFRATLYTYDLRLFDPTWFSGEVDLSERLSSQLASRMRGKRFEVATHGYLDFLALGGDVRFEDLTPSLLRRHFRRGLPVLTGLSATHLYRSMREHEDEEDDLRGEPVGHFVVLTGHDADRRRVFVADPLNETPALQGHHYDVDIQHLVASIFLGIVTHDANFLVIEPKGAAADA